jgi:hypothetical protein
MDGSQPSVRFPHSPTDVVQIVWRYRNIQWGGVPDATLFNPATALVHIAIREPELVEPTNPSTGASARTITGAGAHTTPTMLPSRLCVIAPEHDGVLVLDDE